MITREQADLAIDLHEASPEYPVVNTLVAHQRAMDLAALANVALQEQGVTIGLEASPESLHGLSHREWGDATGALAVLAETTNPAQGGCAAPRAPRWSPPGATASTCDRRRAAACRRRSPRRAGRCTCASRGTWPTVRELIATLAMVAPERPVEIGGVPTYDDVVKAGLGPWLQPPPAER